VVWQTSTGAFCSDDRIDRGEARRAGLWAGLGKAHEGQDRQNDDDQTDEIDDVVHLSFPYAFDVARGGRVEINLADTCFQPKPGPIVPP
jgi:hypothetical protein